MSKSKDNTMFSYLGISVSLVAVFMLTFLNFPEASFSSSESVKNPSVSGSSHWSKGKNMSINRNEVTGVELNSMIYAIGGEDIAAGGNQKDSVEVYDISKDEWTEGTVAPMPLPLDHSVSAVHDGKIYLVGGFLERKIPTDKMFIYDPKKNAWQEGKALPSPRGSPNGQFIDGILYVVGGLNSSHMPVNTNYAYDPKTNTWTTKSPMPTARHHLQTVVVDGKLYALGGRILGNGIQSEDIGESLSNFDRNEVYDPETDSWTVRQHMLVKRSGFTASAGSDGNIYVFGGQGVKKDLNSVEKYDPVSDRWTYDKSMPTARYGLESVTFGDNIYVIGGQLSTYPGRVPLSLNEIFHIRNVQGD